MKINQSEFSSTERIEGRRSVIIQSLFLLNSGVSILLLIKILYFAQLVNKCAIDSN